MNIHSMAEQRRHFRRRVEVLVSSDLLYRVRP